MKKLFPDNWVEVDESPVDRTPKPAQKQRARLLVKDLISVNPQTYDFLIAEIEKDQPCVFTTPEKVELLDDLYEKWAAKRIAKDSVGVV